MNYEERFSYLCLEGKVGKETFGVDRWLNQTFYNSVIWRRVRRDVIIRDNGCDLGCIGYPIGKHIIVHHMNPVKLDTLVRFDDALLDPDYLICVSFYTHQALHYGGRKTPQPSFSIRTPNDTKLW